MLKGLAAGILWGLDTVILSMALSKCSMDPLLAPLISTFLHDLFSTGWVYLYSFSRHNLKQIVAALRSKSGRFIIAGSLIGGPVGMSAYVMAIRLAGPFYTAAISACYPILGALLAHQFLKESLNRKQLILIVTAAISVVVMGYGTDTGTAQLSGILCAVLCAVCWAMETVILSYGMKEVSNETALAIRQPVSCMTYILIIMNVIGGWRVLGQLSGAIYGWIAAAAFCGSASFLLYYASIASDGPIKASALNITYSAWALIFSFLILHETISLRGLVCGSVLVISAILSTMCGTQNDIID